MFQVLLERGIGGAGHSESHAGFRVAGVVLPVVAAPWGSCDTDMSWESGVVWKGGARKDAILRRARRSATSVRIRRSGGGS